MIDGTYAKTVDGFMPVTPKTGYWVASEEVHPNDLELGHLLGVWTDPETGKTWYDKTHHIEVLSTALILARHWNQLAIWDIANNKSIPQNPNY
jgi:hypothetical protein